MLKVYQPVPPFAAIAWLYAAPTVAFGSDDGVTAIDGAATISV